MNAVGIWFLAAVTTTAAWSFPFADFPDGVIDSRDLKDRSDIQWAKLGDRLSIQRFGKSRLLRVHYPSGKWGSNDSGAQFMVSLEPRRSYECSYRVRFPKQFDFAKGGKLPGLAGGTATAGLDRPSGDGWTARYMWREHGKLVLYLYHMDQKGRQGDDISLSVRVQPGKWMQLKQSVTVNDFDKSNGRIRVWVDGRLVLDRKELRLQSEEKALVSKFYFSTFFGGKGKEWAPKKDMSIDFTDMIVK